MTRLSLAVALAAALLAAGCSDSLPPVANDSSAATGAARPRLPAGDAPDASVSPGTVSSGYPAPGGTSFSGTGNHGRTGGSTWTYSAIDNSLFVYLAWAPTSTSASMNGSENPLALVSISGNTAVWAGTSPVMLTTGLSTVNVRLTATARGLDDAPLALIATSSAAAIAAGLPAARGAAVEVTASGFKIHRIFEAQHPSVLGGTYAPFLDVYDALRTQMGASGLARTSWGGTFYWTLVPCEPGSFYGGTNCVPAPAGSYATGGSSTSAIPCAAGTYQPSAGQASCILAPAGHYVPNTGAVEATPCEVGSYSDVTGATACTLAPPGSYVPAAGATSATPCPAGTTTLEAGRTSCDALIEQSLAFTSLPPSPAYVGDTYTVSVSGGGSGNPVILASGSSACTVTGTAVQLVAPGTCVITATQAGGGLYLPATATSQSFTVLDPTPQAQAATIITQVQSLAGNGTLTASESASLTSLLQNAIAAYERGSSRAGANQMGAFINRVEALARSRRITAAQAATLIQAAQQVISSG